MDKILIFILFFVITTSIITIFRNIPEVIIHSPKELPPIPLYQEAWEDVLSCTYFSFRSYKGVRWFSAEGLWLDDRDLAGLWMLGDIYLKTPYIHDYNIIAHELLHHALSPFGHSNWLFRRCDPLAT